MKKVIILTHPLFFNYGGLMQAYALQKTVASMGFDVVTAKSNAKSPSWKQIYTWLYLPLRRLWLKSTGKWQQRKLQQQLRAKNTSRFIEKNIRTTDFFRGKAAPKRETADLYDVYIVGSD